MQFFNLLTYNNLRQVDMPLKSNNRSTETMDPFPMTITNSSHVTPYLAHCMLFNFFCRVKVKQDIYLI